MERKRKKTTVTFVVLLCLMMILSFALVGCNKEEETAPDTTKPSQETTTETKAPEESDTTEADSMRIVDEPITLVWYIRDTETPGVSYNTHVMRNIEKNAEVTGINIEFKALPRDEYNETWQLVFASKNTIPDLFDLRGDQTGEHISDLYGKGYMIDLKPLIDEHTVNLKAYYEEYPEIQKALSLPSGEQCLIGGDNMLTLNAQTMSVRTDWLEKLDKEIPSTLDELNELMQAMLDHPEISTSSEQIIPLIPNDWTWRQLGMMWGLSAATGDGWQLTEDGYQWDYVTQGAREWFEWMAMCVDKGYINEDFLTSPDAEVASRIANDRVGINGRNPLFGCVTDLMNPEGGIAPSLPEDAFWVPFAVAAEGYDYKLVAEALVTRWLGTSISTANEYPVETIKYLDYMFFDDYSIWGEEGITYNIDDNGYKIRTAGQVWFEKLPEGEWFYLWQLHNTDELLMPYFEQDWLKKDQAKYDLLMSQVDMLSAEATPPVMLPIPTIEQGKKISDIMNNCKTAFKENSALFMTGQKELNDETWQEYVDLIYSFGLQDVLDIYNELEGIK